MQRSKSISKLSFMDNSDQKQQKPDQNEQASNKPIRYRHGYTPIKPIRQVIKHKYCFTVLSNVECQIETLKTRSSDGTMIVKEIIRFKFDEDKIWVYKCEIPLPFSNNETPQCPLNSPCYSYYSLPAEYWWKYINACRFMDLVRIKLPMITYYTNEAKAVLFDSPGFFEVRFFADSTKIVYNGDVIRFVKSIGIVFLKSICFY